MGKIWDIISELDELNGVKTMVNLIKYANQVKNTEEAFTEVCEKYKNDIGEDEIYFCIVQDVNITGHLEVFINTASSYYELEIKIKDYFYNKAKNQYRIIENDDNNKKINCFIWIIIRVFKMLEEYHDNIILIEKKYYKENEVKKYWQDLKKSLDNNIMIKDIELLKENSKDLTKKAYDENKKTLDEIYKKFKEIINSRVDNANILDIAEIGYNIADIYERNNEFSKSLEIARILIKVYKEKCKEVFDNNVINYDVTYYNGKAILRRLIGCIYGLSIVDLSKHEDMIDEIEKEFKNAKRYVNKMLKEVISYSEVDRMFIRAFYNSDYAAFLLSKGRYKAKKGLQEEADKLFEKAKRIHKEALKDRKIVLEKIEEDRVEEIIEIKTMIAKSNRNIATAYYYRKQYRSSIKYHKTAIDILTKINDSQQLNQTYDCITGSYVNLWKNDTSKLNLKDFKDCCMYIYNCLIYFNATNERYIKAIDKKNELTKIIKKIPNANIRKNASSFYKDILGR